MHCGCSKMNDKLKDLVEQRFPFFTIRCKHDGSFDSLQCFGDLCICVDERTGSPTSHAKNLTESPAELRNIPCYDHKIYPHEFNYTRPCEYLKRSLINKILNSLSEGVIDAKIHVDICDPDGSFKSIQHNESFSVPIDTIDASQMNCKCARARKLLMDNNMRDIPECCKNGNYKKLACRRGVCYCIDSDGKQVSVEVIDIHKNKLLCYSLSGNECN